MRIAIIGRSEWLLKTAEKLTVAGHDIPLVLTAKEAPEYKVTAKDYENFATRIGAKYIYSSKINKGIIINEIKALGEFDIAISVNYSGIISSDVINLFKLGILNAHGGDLPRYKGNACQAWAILNKEQKIGICVHKMIGGELDNGDIVARDYLKIDVNTRIGSIYTWMEEAIPSLMLSAVEKLQSNPLYVLEVQSKNPEDTLRCYPRVPEDGRVDWWKSNEDILRLVNASSEPFSGAFCHFEGGKMIIWEAELVITYEKYLGIPGQISCINHDNGSVEVITGSGKIRINQIEYEGKRTVPTDFVKLSRKRLS